MYKKYFVSILLIILAIACMISLVGCTPFQLPTGVQECKKLGITIDFTHEVGHWSYGGVLYENENNRDLICKLNHITGDMKIYDRETVTLEELDNANISAEPLYHGTLQSRGAKKRKYSLKNSWKEYVFVKIE